MFLISGIHSGMCPGPSESGRHVEGKFRFVSYFWSHQLSILIYSPAKKSFYRYSFQFQTAFSTHVQETPQDFTSAENRQMGIRAVNYKTKNKVDAKFAPRDIHVRDWSRASYISHPYSTFHIPGVIMQSEAKIPRMIYFARGSGARSRGLNEARGRARV